MRSRPISRVLLRRAESARYDRHSSRPAVADGLEPPTRGLGEQRRRPPIWRCSGWRLPRFTRFPKPGSDSSLWPCSAPSRWPRGLRYCGRALPGILLCGARTFLSPEIAPGAATIWPASQRHYRLIAPTKVTASRGLPHAQLQPRTLQLDAALLTRQRRFSPARSGTIVSSPNTNESGTRQGSRTSVTVSVFRGRP